MSQYEHDDHAPIAKSRALDAVHETARDLHRMGFLDQRRIAHYDVLCLSQTALASVPGVVMKTTENVTFARYDGADDLKTEQDIARYLQAVPEEGGPALMAMADAARASLSMEKRDGRVTRE